MPAINNFNVKDYLFWLMVIERVWGERERALQSSRESPVILHSPYQPTAVPLPRALVTTLHALHSPDRPGTCASPT